MGSTGNSRPVAPADRRWGQLRGLSVVAGLQRLLSRGIGWADWPVVAALLGVVAVFGLLAPGFLSLPNMEAVLVAGAILSVLTVGQAYVIMTAGIDLAIGANTRLASIAIGFLAVKLGWPVPVAAVTAVAISTTLGALSGLIITRGGISDFIVTLGTLSVATGVGLILSDAQSVAVSDPFLLTIATGSLGPLRWMIIIAVTVALLGQVVLRWTTFGLHLLAVGGNRDASREMGIAVGRVRMAAYAIAGLVAGIAGVLLTARLGAAEPAVGTDFLLNSVAAVVLGGVSLFGGRGTIWGPVVGAFVLTAMINGLTLMGVSIFYQPIAVGVVVILSALISRLKE